VNPAHEDYIAGAPAFVGHRSCLYNYVVQCMGIYATPGTYRVASYPFVGPYGDEP
jgi:hypothetical protein